MVAISRQSALKRGDVLCGNITGQRPVYGEHKHFHLAGRKALVYDQVNAVHALDKSDENATDRVLEEMSGDEANPKGCSEGRFISRRGQVRRSVQELWTEG